MITQYRFSLDSAAPLRTSDAYRLYGWLLQQVPEEFGVLLHSQSYTPISQHLSYDAAAGGMVWTVSLLNRQTEEILCPVLDALSEINLHTDACAVKGTSKITLNCVHDLITADGERRTTLVFRSPTSFKQNGRYVLFPQERLILLSLAAKWDELFPEYPVSDPDALQMLESGIHITDYRLRSARYALKGTRIPGFLGEITLEAALSPPMQQIWGSLCALSGFTGIGIKTALGMGGVQLGPSQK